MTTTLKKSFLANLYNNINKTIKDKVIPEILHFSAHNCTKKSVPTYVPNIKPKSSRIKDPIANNPIIIPNREYI